jgi:PKD repeat protein
MDTRKKLVTLLADRSDRRFTATTTASPETVTFTRLRSTVPFRIAWGDGSISSLAANSEATVTHTYAAAGTYRLTLSGANIDNLNIRENTISGSITGLRLVALTIVGNTTITGSITGMALTYLNINGNATITGSITGMALTSLIISGNTTITGSITGMALTSLTVVTGAITLPAVYPVGIHDIRWENSLSQAQVDAVLAQIYSQRAAFTYATPTLDLLGTGNAAPSGVYADEDPPVTGNGYKYELVNDPEAEGFHKWAIQTA